MTQQMQDQSMVHLLSASKDGGWVCCGWRLGVLWVEAGCVVGGGWVDGGW